MKEVNFEPQSAHGPVGVVPHHTLRSAARLGIGNSRQILPSSRPPPLPLSELSGSGFGFDFLVPHCLKKKLILFSMQELRTVRAQSTSILRACGPASPPQISQS